LAPTKWFYVILLFSNLKFLEQYLNGEIEFEITPQGTISEKLRAGGAGIAGFFTRSGAGTLIETGGWPIKYFLGQPSKVEILSQPRETQLFGGKKYLLEHSWTPDVALVKAWKSDRSGNLIYNKSARNFNAPMATTGKFVIAEVESLVEPGVLDPDHIGTSEIYVDAVCLTNSHGAKIFETLRNLDPNTLPSNSHPKTLSPKEKIANRCAQEITNGMYVNIGIGIPT
jgi:3-oxoacid CoA-transferase